MTAREEIADAASVPGLTNVTPFYRQTTKPGEGSVRLDRLNRDTSGLGFMATWQVVIFLPQDLATAEAWLDDNTQTLIDAVSDALVVTSATPSQIAIDTGTVPALVLEGVRAQ